MAISFWGTTSKKKDSGKGGSHGGGSNPDDQSYRHHIGEPSEEEGKKKHWGNAEGNVSGWELRKIRAYLLGHGFSKKEVAIVDAAAHNAVDEKGGQKGMNYGELNETMEVLEQDASKIGFRKEKLGDVREAFEERL